MDAAQDPAPARDASWWALTQEMAEFLYREADLLDERRFPEWLDLLAEDLVYFMPIRRNVKFGQHAARENTARAKGSPGSTRTNGPWASGSSRS